MTFEVGDSSTPHQDAIDAQKEQTQQIIDKALSPEEIDRIWGLVKEAARS